MQYQTKSSENAFYSCFKHFSTAFPPSCGKPVENLHIALLEEYFYTHGMAIYGIGNPLIDFLCYADDNDLEYLSLSKGTMLLVDEKKRTEIIRRMNDRKKTISCGGSCPNTMITLRMLGAETTLAGGVGNDEFGEMYKKRLSDSGVKDETVFFNAATGTSIILLTEDRERTMNTFLGANRLYDEDNVNEESVKKAELFYFTGYMWDTEAQRRAVRKALGIAKENGVKVAFDLADPFAVGRYRSDFLNLLENYCDIVFANSEEARFLFSNYDAYECCRSMGKLSKIAIVKNGKKGSYISDNGKIIEIPLYGTKNPVDTTGAGDTYAAGFLYGYTKGYPTEKSGRIASFLAGEIISQLGAQFTPEKAKELAERISSGL